MANLYPNVFLRRLAEEVPRLIPPEMAGLHTELRGRLLKLWYGEEKQVHYEVWLHEQSQQLELGLHCEAAPDYNDLIRRGLAAELLEIKHRLGQSVELEPWDHGWVRIYETHPLYPLDEARLREISIRCASFIRHLQPLYEEIVGGLPPQYPRLNFAALR